MTLPATVSATSGSDLNISATGTNNILLSTTLGSIEIYGAAGEHPDILITAEGSSLGIYPGGNIQVNAVANQGVSIQSSGTGAIDLQNTTSLAGVFINDSANGVANGVEIWADQNNANLAGMFVDTTEGFAAFTNNGGSGSASIGMSIAGTIALTTSGVGSTSIEGVTYSRTAPTAGQVLTASSPTAAAWATPSRTTAIQFVIDGGGSTPGNGPKGQFYIPYNCTITGFVLTADQSGSAQLDVLRTPFATFPGSLASIAGSDFPTLTSAQSVKDTVLTGWGSTALNAGDELQVSVTSAATVTRLNLTLIITVP